jgi:site-specific DNA-methyltransferase (adenine-specific)
LTVHYRGEGVELHHGDCLNILPSLPDNSIDAVVTDPPYGLEFMGKKWDAPWKPDNENLWATRDKSADLTGKSSSPFLAAAVNKYRAGLPFQLWCQQWATECLRVLKPGGHLLAFGGTRTWHRLACAIEDAGFEIRDSIAWLYGSGFPKSLDVSKAIDKATRGVPHGGSDPTSPNHGKYRTQSTEGKRWDGDSGQGYGAGGSQFLTDGQASTSATDRAGSGAADVVSEAKQWQGWGTALKPAHESIIVARKPIQGTAAANVLAHGTGALNIDATRVPASDKAKFPAGYSKSTGAAYAQDDYSKSWTCSDDKSPAGRWPTNVVLDETQAAELDKQSGTTKSNIGRPREAASAGDGWGMTKTGAEYSDTGGASRFYPVFKYHPKALTDERPNHNNTSHPTVKPVDLIRWLIRLVTPPGGTVLDPFAGTGTTAEAAIKEHKQAVLIEREETYLPLIVARLSKPMEIGFNFEESA